MRTLTGPETTLLAAAQKAVANVKVEIRDAAAVYQDWFDHLLSVSWGASIDQPVAEVRLTLKRDAGLENSLSPFRGDSTLNIGGAAIDAGREIRISPATTAWNTAAVSADYKQLFYGTTVDVDFANAAMEVLGRDPGGVLMKRQIKTASEFRSEAGEPLENVIQTLLDVWAPGTVLYVPTSPGFLVTSIDWGKGSLFEAIRTAAGSIGWDIRYLWDNLSGAFQLTLFEPERTKTVPDWTLASDRYFKVTQLGIRSDFVRNYIVVSFYNTDASARQTVFATDATSVARFGEQWMEIIEADTSPINTSAEAQALADAALSDLAWPIAEKQVELPFFWPVEVGDLIRFTANGVHADEDIDLAVTGYQHRLDRSGARTTLTLRGKPSGFYRDWLRRGKEEPEEVDAESLGLGVAIREKSRTDTTITYEIVWGAAVISLWIYDRLHPNPPPENPWPTPDDLPSTILNGFETEYTVTIPPPGFIRYILFEPRDATLAVGTLEHIIVDPTSEEPDRIVSMDVLVNDEDGSVVVKVFAADRTRSYRYAYAIGPIESPPAGPTDAEVEVGTVRLITGGDAFVLPAGTVGWNEVLRVRAAPYINTTGLGTTGAGDHGEIRSAQDIRLKPPVEMDITTETEAGAVGTFGVTVRDGSGVATDLYYRTKSGHNAFSSWILKTATPTDGVEYVETVALVEDHPSAIEFRLDYVFNGAVLQLVVSSSPLDAGQIPNGTIKPVLNENNDSASADLLGDFDTNSWKIAASTAGMPSDATVRAATPVNGRMVRASVLGALVTGLTLGQSVFYKAFPYSGAGGTGNESSAAITAEAIYKVVPPKLDPTTATESGAVGTFGVTVRDPTGQADALYYRTKSGVTGYGAWTLKTASPTDNTEYQETVALVEDHQSYVEFRLDYVIAGDPRFEREESPGFDIGAIPDGVIIPTISVTGGADAVAKGDFDTLSWKVAASTSGFPSDATVRATTAVNGRIAIFSNLLGAGALPGQRVFYKGFAYSATGGGGTESSAAITAQLDRGNANAPKIQEEVVRSGTTATVTLTIRDDQKSITAIEFNKREGDGAATGWVSSWDSSSGTMGSNEALSRAEAVTVADGKDSEFRWRVVYTDEMGVSRTIGNTVPLTNLQSVSKTIMVPHTQFISQRPESEIMRYNTIYGFPVAASGSVLAQASMVLPKGVTVTSATMRLYKSGGTCTVQAVFGRVNRASTTYTNLMAVTHGGSGWEDLTASFSETVADDVYTAIAQFTNVNSEDVRVAWFEITYTVPSYKNSY